MLLCDIGNTSFHFLDGEKDYKKSVDSFDIRSVQREVYYISVNVVVSEKLKDLKNWINVAIFIDINSYYKTMGIDRICAIKAVQSAVVIDAGSAITIDIVENGVFEGGFIYPGVTAMQKTYKNISSALDYSFNFDLELDIMPKNSQDAISYGYIKTLYVEVTSHQLPIILTGGDAKKFHKIFKNAQVDEELIFSGMKKIIKKHKEKRC